MADKNSGWACTHSATIVGEDNLGVTIQVICYWQNQGWRYDMNGVSAWVYCAGQEVCVKSSSAIDTTGNNQAAYAMGSHNFYIAKNHSSQSISCYAKITSTSSYVSGTKSSGASSVGVSAKPSYAVTYNLNGGSGSFGNQTKWYNEELTLHSATPTRTGHNFVRWNTNTSNTGTGYAPGGKYNGNAGLTLYAIWTPQTHTVTFNANGGTGAPAAQTKVYGTVLKLSSTIPTRANYNFKGWATSANGGVVYSAGGDYGTDVDVTLYAVWELAYVKPRISNFTANRCTSDGTISETGTYIKVSFNWNTDNTVVSVWVDWTIGLDWSSQISKQLPASGTSGSITTVIGNGDISIETSYSVKAFVRDGDGDHYTYSPAISIGTTKFPIDIKAGGKGVAIGKVAENDDRFDVNFISRFRDKVYIDGNLEIDGGLSINLVDLNATGNVAMADTWDSGTFDKIGKGECFNKSGFYTLPVDDYYWYHLINVRHRNGAADGPNYGMQIRKQFDTFSKLEGRFQNNGNWSGWEHIQRSFTIFENSSGASSATLSLDASHLRYMEIFYSHNYGAYGFNSVRVEKPNAKRVTLDLIEGQGAYVVSYTGHI